MSQQVHGGYVRQLRDAAVGGVQVVIALRCGVSGAATPGARR
jgi:hypothetical protein